MEEGLIEDGSSMLITLTLRVLAVLCDMLSLGRWFEVLILHTYQIWHRHPFFSSAMSKACSKDDISRVETNFEPR
jgi:hypothetical protein